MTDKDLAQLERKVRESPKVDGAEFKVRTRGRIWFADVLSCKTIRPRRFRWLVFHSDDDLASSPAGGHHVVGFG